MSRRHPAGVTHRRRGTTLAAVASGVVLLTAATYMVLYLARWEWTRALISAAVLGAMLSIVSTVLVLSRISELTTLVRASLDSRRGTGAATPTPDTIDTSDEASTATVLREASRAHAARHFNWLRDNSRTGVFIPVLLGAGMILSAVAWLVERLAGVLTGATLDRRLAGEIPLDLPLGDHSTRPPNISRRPSTRRRPGAVAATALALLVLAIGVELTRRVTQSNEAEGTAPGTTSIVLEVRSASSSTPTATADALWTVCSRLLDEPPVISAIAATDRFVAFKVDKSLGRTAQRRVIGCLEDFTLDRVVADVVELQTTPTDDQ